MFASTTITSTRVYMFALAVADLLVCVYPCLVFSECVTGTVARLPLSCIIDASMTFSFERLAAVKRTHTHVQHGSTKYIIITDVAVRTSTILSDVARFMRNDPLVRISDSFVYVSCASIMITCYTLMPDAMLKKVRASQNQVGMQSLTRPSKPGTSHIIVSTIVHDARAKDPGLWYISTKDEANMQSSATTPVPVTTIN